MKLLALSAFAFAVLGARAGAETLYDQPYMADITWSRPDRPLDSLVELSDLIVIGTSASLTPQANETWYKGRITPVEVIKGTLPQPFPESLFWKPSATGLRAGSKHLLFLRRNGGRLEVLKEMFLSAAPDGLIRAYGYLDGAAEAALLVVRKLAGARMDADKLAQMLLAEAGHDQAQRRQTAALLATDLHGVESIPTLEHVIAGRGESLPLAVYALVSIEPRRGVEAAFKLLADNPKLPSQLVAQVFDALARSGRAEIVEPLFAFGSTPPGFQVSSAFVLAQLVGEKAIPVIERWRAAPDARTVKERLNRGGATTSVTRGELLGQAIRLARGAGLDPAATPSHLLHFPGLYARAEGKIVDAPAADVVVAMAYPRFEGKGLVAGGQWLTIMTARTEVAVNEEVRVIHVLEVVEPGHEVYVMGPKPVYEEYLDGVLRAARYTGPGEYDGAVMKSPWADYNYEVTSYRFDRPGVHTVQWKGGDPSGESLGIPSNILTITVK